MSVKAAKVIAIEPLEAGVDVVDVITDEGYYVTSNGLVHHNSGIVYGASIIMNLAKAQLKEDNAVVGQRVIAKAQKNRFCKPVPCEFYIRFDTALNPYVGLQDYVSWENCGVGRGKFISDKEYEKLTPAAKASCQYCEANQSYFVPSDSGRNICKDDGSMYPLSDLFTSKVFTQDVLERLDVVISNEYKYASSEDVPEDVDGFEADPTIIQDVQDEVNSIYKDTSLENRMVVEKESDDVDVDVDEDITKGDDAPIADIFAGIE